MSDPADINDRLEAAAVKAEGASEIMRRFANDPAGTYITTESGPLPSIAEWLELNEAALGGVPALQQFNTDLQNAADPAKGAALIGYDNSTVAAFLGRLRGAAKPIQDFGVVGDGIADDSAAMALVAQYTGRVTATGLTISTNGFTVTGGLQLEGGTIKFRSNLQRILINASNFRFRNVVFDADSRNVNTALIRIPATYTNFSFENCTFQNITGIAGSANQYGIYMDADGAIGSIAGCRFVNISNVSTPAPLSGFCGGILHSATSVGSLDLRITNCTFQNIYTTNIAGDINNSDADGIRFFGPTPSVRSNAHIRGCTFIDVQKSAIKTSGTAGVSVDGVIITNDRSDIAMVAGLRFQAADGSVVKNVVLSGRMSIGVNIRSRDFLLDGVTYEPIDTARDIVASGLIQFQSADASITERVKVCNVIGRNVGCAFDFDPSGVTANDAFRYVSMHNVEIYGLGVASTGTTARVQRGVNFTFEDVRIYDSSASWINQIDFTSARGIRFSRCRFECRRELFSWTPGVSGCSVVDFDNCSFNRPDIAATENFGMVVIRDVSNNPIDRVAIRNCSVSCPTYSAVGNQHALRFYATNGHIDGLNIFVRGVGGNVSPPTGWVSASVLATKISDVKVSSDVTLTNGSGGYAVDLSATSVANVVTDIHNSTGPGVRAPAGANNNLIDSVAGKSTAVNNGGTGNTVGSAHVLP